MHLYISSYEIFHPLGGPKNKPNTNPIQTQTKSIQTQFWPKNQGGKPKQTQFKPNQSQFWPKIAGGKAKQTQNKTKWIKAKSTSVGFD